MNVKNQIKLSETVALVDVAFLNLVIDDVKNHFEGLLNRTLQDIDLSQLALYLSFDAGITGEKNDIQFLFVYDQASEKLSHSHPSDLKKELDGVAFQSPVGEYSFMSVPCEGMVSREELFLDLLTIVGDSADVKKLIVLSFNEEYGDGVTKILNGLVGKKEIVQFRMNEPEESVSYDWDMLAFSLMQALGIRADELE